MNRVSIIFSAFGLIVLLGVGGDVAAFVAEPPAGVANVDSSKLSDKTADKKQRPELSKSELAMTMAFASEHHPELARLLEHLRKSRPADFQRAARELNQQIQILEKLRERKSPRYEYQLELWKSDSQIRVLVAKWSLSKDDALEEEIRALLQHRQDTRLAQLKADSQRLAEQMQKIEKQMAAMSDSQLEREWEQLAKKTNASRKDSNKNSSN